MEPPRTCPQANKHRTDRTTIFFFPFGPFDPFNPASATPKKSRRRRSKTHLPQVIILGAGCLEAGGPASLSASLPLCLFWSNTKSISYQFPVAWSAACVQPQTTGLQCTMVYQETPARRHCSDRSKPKSHRTGQIRHYSTPALGINHVISGSLDDSKEALVQGWLNNVQALGSGLDARGPPAHKPSNPNRLSRPRSLPPARGAPNALPRSRRPGISESISQSSRERRHRRLRASFNGPNGPDDRDDSSVIAPRPLADNSRARRPKLKSAADASSHERSNKRPKSGPDSQESGSSPAPSPPEYNFEKRARYKTKSDRYDTVKQDGIDKDNKSKKSKTRSTAETRRTSRGNRHLASARDVMDNFNSQSILSGRITVSLPQPSPQAGLIELERCPPIHEQGCLTMVEFRRSQVSPVRRLTADIPLTVL